MKITANQDFLDDRDRYEDGVEYDVPEEKAVYFVRNGWADSDEINEPTNVPAEAGLDVHDSTNGQAATTKTARKKG